MTADHAGKLNMKSGIICVMLDPREYKEKPKDFIRAIQGSVRKCSISVRTLAEKLVHGSTMRPGVLEGGRKQQDWKQQQIFALDFDNGSDPDEVYRKSVSMGLTPAFLYPSFSDTPEHRKFRIVFVTQNAITNMTSRDKIQATLMGVLGDSDPTCCNRDRIYFGGKSGVSGIMHPDYQARIDAEYVLGALWKEEYRVHFPAVSKGKTQTKSSDSNAKENPKRTAYQPSDSGKVIRFLPVQVRRTMTFDIACLERLMKLRRWVEGDHRERLIFIYYNCRKALTSGTEAAEACQELNQQFTEPLDDYALASAMQHTDVHIAVAGFEKYGDGLYTYSPNGIVDTLEMTKEEIEETGILSNYEMRKQYADNNKLSGERDRKIAELYFAGYGSKAIKTRLPESIQCSLSCIKATIKRLGLRTATSIDQVDFETRRRYAKMPRRRKVARGADSQYPTGAAGGGWELLSFAGMDQARVASMLEDVDRDYLILGGGGSGKSTLIKNFLDDGGDERIKSSLVLCPTGKAAAVYPARYRARTIHSALLVMGDKLYDPRLYYPDSSEVPPVESMIGMRRVIVDEIGMVRSDYMAEILRQIRLEEKRAGRRVQLICLGDFRQIKPVVSKDDRQFLHWEIDPYAYATPLWGDRNWSTIVLTGQRRICGDDAVTEQYKSLIERIADGDVTAVPLVNKMLSHEEDPDAVCLCAHKRDVRRYNAEYVNRFSNRVVLSAQCDMKPSAVKEWPCEEQLELAAGMRVMVTRNEDRYKNGETGTVVDISADTVQVRFDNTKRVRAVKRSTYFVGGAEVRQFPLTVAHAITVHKSQGSSLDAVNIVGPFFDDGMLYTALSRCRSVSDIHIVGDLEESDLHVSSSALKFLRHVSMTAVNYMSRTQRKAG